MQPLDFSHMYVWILIQLGSLTIDFFSLTDDFQAHCVKKTFNMILILFNEIPYVKPIFLGIPIKIILFLY